MVNLRAIANAATRSINPNVTSGMLYRSTGSTKNADYSRTPTYSAQPLTMQIQALSYGDLRQAEGVNLQGTRRAIYVNGAVAGIIRPAQKGGDIVVFPPNLLPEGPVWLVAMVLEQWPDWAKFIITLQNIATSGAGNKLDYSDPKNSQFFPGLQ